MKVEPGWIVALVLFAIAQAAAIVRGWWTMRADIQSTRAEVQSAKQEMAQLKAAHEKETSVLAAGQTALSATVGTIQIEIAKGFARIEEQIKTLFREQEKH